MLLAPLVTIRALAAPRNMLQKELSPAGDHSSMADVRHPLMTALGITHTVLGSFHMLFSSYQAAIDALQ